MQDILWIACILYNAAFIRFKIPEKYTKEYPFRTALCVMTGAFGTVAIVSVILCAYVIKIGGAHD